MKKITLNIDGMSCNGCVNRVRTAIEKTGATATVEIGQAKIEFDPEKTSPQHLIESLEKIGFDATPAGDPS